jgi:hypothetical protein
MHLTMSRLGRRAALDAVCVATLVAAVVTPDLSSAASPPPSSAGLDLRPVVAGSGYLALGDSVSFGFREADTAPPPDYHRAATFVGYPEDVGAALGLRVTNAACPGETSASLIRADARSNGCEHLAVEKAIKK